MNKHVKLTERAPTDLSRRSFLVGSAATGLVLGYAAVPGIDSALAAPSNFEPSVWYSIAPDGLVTVNQDPAVLRDVVESYRSAGGRGTLALQVHVAWAPDEEAAFALAREQWTANVVGPPVAWDLDTPESFDALVPLQPVLDLIFGRDGAKRSPGHDEIECSA